MIVELQRYTDDVVTRRFHDRSRDRAVDTAGHGDDDALFRNWGSGWRLKIGHVSR
jgi:hypothetical protein